MTKKYITRRNFLIQTTTISLSTGLTGCSKLGSVGNLMLESTIDLAHRTERRMRLKRLGISIRQQKKIQQTALRRIEQAAQLKIPFFGMSEQNYSKVKSLYQQNFSEIIKSSEPSLWALSKIYWIEEVLDDDDRIVLLNLPILRQHCLETKAALIGDIHAQKITGIMLASVGMTIELMAGNYEGARLWYLYGYPYRKDGIENTPEIQALKKISLIQFYSLGIETLSKLNTASLNTTSANWYLIEQKQKLSKNAESLSDFYSSIDSNKVIESLQVAVNYFDAVAAISVCRSGSTLNIAIDRGGISFNAFPINMANKLFNRHDLEILLYGSTFRKSFYKTGLGGWMGTFAGTYKNGVFSFSSSTMLKHISSINHYHWEFFVGQVDAAFKSLKIKKGAKICLLLPDEMLLFPIRAAINHKNGKQFLENYNITISPSLHQTANSINTRLSKQRTLLGLYNPTDDPTLKNTNLEKYFAQRSLKLDKVGFIQNNFKPNEFLNFVSQVSPRYLYLSTHGEGVKDPKIYIGKNSFLSAEDVIKYNGKLNCELVIISACEAGMTYDFKPVPTNLTTAFLAKGVKGVVSALWPIEVNSTNLLMNKFMELFINQNMEASTALTQAQIWLRDSSAKDLIDLLLVLFSEYPPEMRKPIINMLGPLQLKSPNSRPYNNPYYWAAFNYWGG